MSTTAPLFSGLTVTADFADEPHRVVDGSDWLSIQLSVVSLSPGTTVVFSVQWSFDGSTWSFAEPVDIVGTVTEACSKVQRIPVKGVYWRLTGAVTGDAPEAMVSGNVLYSK